MLENRVLAARRVTREKQARQSALKCPPCRQAFFSRPLEFHRTQRCPSSSRRHHHVLVSTPSRSISLYRRRDKNLLHLDKTARLLVRRVACSSQSWVRAAFCAPSSPAFRCSEGYAHCTSWTSKMLTKLSTAPPKSKTQKMSLGDFLGDQCMRYRHPLETGHILTSSSLGIMG